MPGHRQRQALFPRQTWCAVVPHHQVTPTWSADWKLHLTALESCSHVVTCQQWWPCTDFLFLVHLLCISKCVFFSTCIGLSLFLKGLRADLKIWVYCLQDSYLSAYMGCTSLSILNSQISDKERGLHFVLDQVNLTTFILLNTNLPTLIQDWTLHVCI